MNERKLGFAIIIALTIAAICVFAWVAYYEITRPTTPVITIEDSIVSWVATGAGDMTAGRFIRSYEVRVAIGSEIFMTDVEGPTEIGEIMAKDLADLDLPNPQLAATDAEAMVRTLRNIGAGTRVGRWSNAVVWLRE